MDHLQILTARVLDDRKTASYKWLSRHLSVNVDTAKRMLYEFVRTKLPGEVNALYYVQGERIDGSIHCTAVSEARLEEIQNTLVHWSTHVLSVQPGKVPDIDALVRVDLLIARQDTIEITRLCGTIQNADIHSITANDSNKKNNRAIGAKVPSTSNFNTKSHSADSALLTPSASSRKPQVALQVSKSAGKIASTPTSFFASRGNSKGSDAPASNLLNKATLPVKASTVVQPKDSETATSNTTSGTSSDYVASGDVKSGPPSILSHQPKPKLTPLEHAKSKQQSQQISQMFDDDGDSETQLSDNSESLDKKRYKPDDTQDNSQPTTSSPKRIDPPKRKIHTVAILSDSEPLDVSVQKSVDDDKESDSKLTSHLPHMTSEGEMQADSEDVKMDEKRRVRKHRKIRVTKRVMVGKYMKTVDVSEVESHSEDELEAAKPSCPKGVQQPKSPRLGKNEHGDDGPDVAPHTLASTKTKGKSKATVNSANQKSLLSYFGKR
ncbi:hypothetical protein BSLG_006522 [Batrachochytrium salamandrivorans]|nr:hypothetical protein BASA81_017739 [Batrachochytrium salamandrivorans]KAJ1338885.1 hypothetical protein BSLG_006522 [Batrachochytrium salamandrivorans]